MKFKTKLYFYTFSVNLENFNSDYLTSLPYKDVKCYVSPLHSKGHSHYHLLLQFSYKPTDEVLETIYKPLKGFCFHNIPCRFININYFIKKEFCENKEMFYAQKNN